MILPVILGTDVNAYGMARMFHMAFGIKSRLLGQGKLWMTGHSSICDIKVIDNLLSDDIFPNALVDEAKVLLNRYYRLILIAASDNYAEMAIKYREKLSQYFFMPFPRESNLELVNKRNFYDTASKFGLPIPKTVIIEKENYKDAVNPFGYPSVLKPSSSVDYFPLSFEGKKKAYILKDEEEFKNTLKTIYENTTYSKEMVLQEFIPGDDSHMYVLNAYVSSESKVKLMAFGHVIMEDPTPELIGNYLGIINANGEDVFHVFKKFLEDLNYTGFANFDMKYDSRDGIYKVFEINLRQGRSSFYSALSGANLAEAVYNDAAGIEFDTIYSNREFLWLGAKPTTILKYIGNEDLKNRCSKLIEESNYGTTLNYSEDRNFFRDRAIKKYYDSYDERFRNFFEEK